jgi:hypothetical protein
LPKAISGLLLGVDGTAGSVIGFAADEPASGAQSRASVNSSIAVKVQPNHAVLAGLIEPVLLNSRVVPPAGRNPQSTASAAIVHGN